MKITSTAIGAAILLSLGASAAGAQSPALRVDGTRLRTGVDSLAIYLVRGADTTRTGTLYDALSVEPRDGIPMLRRVYRSVDQVLGVRLDSLVDVQATLAPVSHRSRTDQNQEFYAFAGGRAAGWVRLANGDSVAVDAPVPAGTFNASTVDLVVRAAPLEPGWTAAIPAFLPSTRTVVLLQARVAGNDTVAGEAAWRVVVDFGGMPVTFWIGQSSRALLQQQMQLRPDVSLLFAQPRIPVSKERAG